VVASVVCVVGAANADGRLVAYSAAHCFGGRVQLLLVALAYFSPVVLQRHAALVLDVDGRSLLRRRVLFRIEYSSTKYSTWKYKPRYRYHHWTIYRLSPVAGFTPCALRVEP